MQPAEWLGPGLQMGICCLEGATPRQSSSSRRERGAHYLQAPYNGLMGECRSRDGTPCIAARDGGHSLDDGNP